MIAENMRYLTNGEVFTNPIFNLMYRVSFSKPTIFRKAVL